MPPATLLQAGAHLQPETPWPSTRATLYVGGSMYDKLEKPGQFEWNAGIQSISIIVTHVCVERRQQKDESDDFSREWFPVLLFLA